MKPDDMIKQLDISMQTIGKVIPFTGQLLWQPGAFFKKRSKRADSRRREALDIFVFSVAWFACLYYVILASIRPVKSIEIYFFGALVFNVTNLLCMSGIYAGLACLADGAKRFQLHLWNALCTLPILCLAALLSQDYSAAWTRQLLEDRAVELDLWAEGGMWVVVIGYVCVARSVHSALRHNAGFGWFKAASVAGTGFAATMVFLTFPLTSSYARLLKVVTT